MEETEISKHRAHFSELLAILYKCKNEIQNNDAIMPSNSKTSLKGLNDIIKDAEAEYKKLTLKEQKRRKTSKFYKKDLEKQIINLIEEKTGFIFMYSNIEKKRMIFYFQSIDPADTFKFNSYELRLLSRVLLAMELKNKGVII